MTGLQFFGLFLMVVGIIVALLMWALIHATRERDDEYDDQFVWPKPIDLDEERAKREGHL